MAQRPEEQPIEKPDTYALYKALSFHPRIREASEALFKDRHYSSAILEAFKELNTFVKEIADCVSMVLLDEQDPEKVRGLATEFRKANVQYCFEV